MRIKTIKGSIQLKSDLDIIELGNIISELALGGAKLKGLEENIYDEVPAIYSKMLGVRVILHGYPEKTDSQQSGYWIDLIPSFKADGDERINISEYLFQFLQTALSEVHEVEVVSWSEL